MHRAKTAKEKKALKKVFATQTLATAGTAPGAAILQQRRGAPRTRH